MLQVFTTVPDRATADRIAAELVEGRFAACVQVLGPIDSTYRWQGKVERSGEWLCLAKTTEARFPDLERAIARSHPYDTPEIVAVPIVGGSERYLAWLAESVGEEG
jgi:periplasmic divalent cation tolerance protein